VFIAFDKKVVIPLGREPRQKKVDITDFSSILIPNK
jgi:hypothetical protein